MRNLALAFAFVASVGLIACNNNPTPNPGGGGTPTVDAGGPARDSGTPVADSGTPDAGGGGPKTVMVTVGPGTSLTFVPSAVTIHVGDTVMWNFNTAGHTVTSGSGCVPDNKFCSPNDSACGTAINGAGTSYSHTFTTAGSFPYFCSTHCTLGMTGTVTVQ